MISTYSPRKIVTKTVTKILHFLGGKNTIESRSLWGEFFFNQLTVNKHGRRGMRYFISEIEMLLWKKFLSTRQSIVTRFRCSAVVQNYSYFFENLVLQLIQKSSKSWRWKH